MENSYPMDFHAFYEKLYPFFTDKQINALNEYALETARDAHEGLECANDTPLMWNMGREFVCILLSEMTDDCDPIGSITGIAGGTMSAISFESFVAQLDYEW